MPGRVSKKKYKTKWRRSNGIRTVTLYYPTLRPFPEESPCPVMETIVENDGGLESHDNEEIMEILEIRGGHQNNEHWYLEFEAKLSRPKTITQKYIRAVQSRSWESESLVALDLEFIGAMVRPREIPQPMIEVARRQIEQVNITCSRVVMVPLDCSIYNGATSLKYLLKPPLAVNYPMSTIHYHDLEGRNIYWKARKQFEITDNLLYCRNMEQLQERINIQRMQEFLEFVEREHPALAFLNGTNAQAEFLNSKHRPEQIYEKLIQMEATGIILFNGTQDCPMLGLHNWGIPVYDLAYRMETKIMVLLNIQQPQEIKEEQLLEAAIQEMPSFSLTSLAEKICPDKIRKLRKQGLQPHDSRFDSQLTYELAQRTLQFRRRNENAFKKLEEILQRSHIQIPSEEVWAKHRLDRRERLTILYAQFATKHPNFPADDWDQVEQNKRDEITAEWSVFIQKYK